jgi:acetyl/propionyl-CoA carboxylase alpha subunit
LRLLKTRSRQRRDHPPIEAIALHVEMADEAVLIEAAEPVASYLDSNAIIAAARYRADLV